MRGESRWQMQKESAWRGAAIVSNRLPLSLEKTDDGYRAAPSAGGLVRALQPILRKGGGRWIGWSGASGLEGKDALQEASETLGFELCPVPLQEEEIENYYRGFSNSVLWPLFHGMSSICDFRGEYWDDYVRVNQQFAATIDEVESADAPLWLQDYHLMLVAKILRAAGRADQKMAFFLHIPFPTVEDFMRLPWRTEVLDALLHHDLVGFQCDRDRRNFLACVERLGTGAVVGEGTLVYENRSVAVGVFPIGIDFDDFEERAASPEVERRIAELKGELGPRKILLGVDRLDYTKGLPERVRIFERLLERHPEMKGEVLYLQVAVPSREQVDAYRALKAELDEEIGRVCGRFSTPTGSPIRYLYNTVSDVDLSSLYRLSDVAVVTPLCDGMNLVAKEFCASRVDEDGVLLLSERAGAASQLGDAALLVNPFDLDGTADALYRALTMEPEERGERMRRARAVCRDQAVSWWAEQVFSALVDPTRAAELEVPSWPPPIHPPNALDSLGVVPIS